MAGVVERRNGDIIMQKPRPMGIVARQLAQRKWEEYNARTSGVFTPFLSLDWSAPEFPPDIVSLLRELVKVFRFQPRTLIRLFSLNKKLLLFFRTDPHVRWLLQCAITRWEQMRIETVNKVPHRPHVDGYEDVPCKMIRMPWGASKCMRTCHYQPGYKVVGSVLVPESPELLSYHRVDEACSPGVFAAYVIAYLVRTLLPTNVRKRQQAIFDSGPDKLSPYWTKRLHLLNDKPLNNEELKRLDKAKKAARKRWERARLYVTSKFMSLCKEKQKRSWRILQLYTSTRRYNHLRKRFMNQPDDMFRLDIDIEHNPLGLKRKKKRHATTKRRAVNGTRSALQAGQLSTSRGGVVVRKRGRSIHGIYGTDDAAAAVDENPQSPSDEPSSKRHQHKRAEIVLGTADGTIITRGAKASRLTTTMIDRDNEELLSDDETEDSDMDADLDGFIVSDGDDGQDGDYCSQPDVEDVEEEQYNTETEGDESTDDDHDVE